MNDHPAPPGVPTCYRHPGRESHIRCQRCGRPICPDCMRDASVGFQCPDCVAEGRKATRSGRTAFGGLRPTNASVTTGVLIAINAVVWLAISVTGGSDSRLVGMLALHARGLCDAAGGFFATNELTCSANGGDWLPGVVDGAWWQLVTSGFTHVAITHIAFNMLALWAIGPQLELVFGRVRFLALYFLSLLAGSAVVLWAAGEYQFTLGASGAIYGLFAALLVVARRVGGDMRALWGLIAVNVLITFVVPNISWQGHLGGFIGGGLAAIVLAHAPRQHRTAYQVAGLVAIAAVVALAIVARTVQLG